MVQVTQTEEDIKIIIELNRLIIRKPDIILLPTYLKFNNPPIFFERHLTHEIDEVASFCRIFKTEARLILIKKKHGIWPEIFLKLSKEDLFKRRLEISDQIVERNKERDKVAIERYEQKRRNEIEKEVQRETAIRERVKQFEDNACREALMVGVRKETHLKSVVENTINNNNNNNGYRSSGRLGTPLARHMPSIRNSQGKINVSFSNFVFNTPKRESQQGLQRPFIIQDNCTATDSLQQETNDSLNE